MNYILIDTKPVPVSDIYRWSLWMETADRSVARETVNGYDVSTVFLGMDHAFGGDVPILFETMVFGDGDIDQYQERYSTYNEAVAGHQRIVDAIREGTLL